MKKLNFSYNSSPIMTINNMCRKKIINLSPDFQRGYIWKREFKDELIVSILSNFPIGNIIISKDSSKMDVVDGQQRLTTINNFIGTDFESYEVRTQKSVEKIKEIIRNYVTDYSNILTDDDKKDYEEVLKSNVIRYKNFPQLVKDDFLSYNLNITYLTSVDSKAIIEYFKYVQNQESLKAGEIINSIYLYNDDLNDLTSKISDKELLIDYLGIRDKRNEFDKHFINFVGVLSRKLNLNTQSKNIVSFAQKFTYDMVNQNINLLVTNLNNISSLKSRYSDLESLNLNTRMLKVFLSYLSFYVIDDFNFFEIVKALLIIDKMHMNEKVEVRDNITFIELRSRNLKDIRRSADNFHYFLDAKVIEHEANIN